MRVAAGIGRIQPPDGLAFFPLLPVGEGRDEGWSTATLFPEPCEGGGFDDGFVEAHGVWWTAKRAVKIQKPVENSALRTSAGRNNGTAKFIAKMSP